MKLIKKFTLKAHNLGATHPLGHMLVWARVLWPPWTGVQVPSKWHLPPLLANSLGSCQVISRTHPPQHTLGCASSDPVCREAHGVAGSWLPQVIAPSSHQRPGRNRGMELTSRRKDRADRLSPTPPGRARPTRHCMGRFC